MTVGTDWIFSAMIFFQQGKKVCKTTALRCYHFSSRFLLATAKWLKKQKNKKLQCSLVKGAGAQ